MSIFNRDHYPTPQSVIDQMGADVFGKVVLDPNCGAGNMLRWASANGASSTFGFEIVPELAKLASDYGTVQTRDFLKVQADEISHVQVILMNPPFSSDENQILHAWEIAPEGCEIYALCNWESINQDRYSYNRVQLSAVIKDYGEAYKLGQVFKNAERATNVEIGLVTLFKPMVSDQEDWDGFYYTEDMDPGSAGLMPYNEIRAMVNTYTAAIRQFKVVELAGHDLARITRSMGYGDGVVFKGYSSGDRHECFTAEEFARNFQKFLWQSIFKKLNMGKYVTKGVMEDINRFIHIRKNYPFTMRNIYRMLDIIIGTWGQNMQKAIVEAIDNFTRHTHENRYGVEGWKTNDGHMLAKKFIIGYILSLIHI